MIYESSDGGKTIYSREPGSNIRTLIKKNDEITYATFIDILKTAENIPALKTALDKAILMYNLSKNYD